MRVGLAAAIFLFTVGCAQQPTFTWVRMDGQHVRGNPLLMQAFDADDTICRGEMQKANLSGVAVHGGGLAGIAVQMERNAAVSDVLRGCMAQRGYAYVDEKLAEQKLAEYRANAQLAVQQPKGPQTLTGSIAKK
jgi:hypothetical protein